MTFQKERDLTTGFGLANRDCTDVRPHIPAYLDATAQGVEGGRWAVSPEKEAYLRYIAGLVETLEFRPGENIAVLGVGMAGESNILAEAIRRRYPNGGGPTLLSLERSIFVMASVDKSTPHPEVRSGLRLIDVADLQTIVGPESCRLITASSIMHGFKSEGGWDLLIHNFKQMTRAVAKKGLIIVRDYYSPDFQPCEVELKSTFARRFYEAFAITFNPKVIPGFLKEPLERVGENVIRTNTLVAFDLITHGRMFINDYYRQVWGGENMFKPHFWKQWQETEGVESYVLTRRKYPNIEAVCDALVAASSSGVLTYDLQLKDDSSDDTMLREHFGCTPDIYPSKRCHITFTKK